MKQTILFLLLFAYGAAFAQPLSEGWNFSYPDDDFLDDALLDLRYLNEDRAGETGFIRLSEDGESFVRGDGEPIRFWPINGGSLARDLSSRELRDYARFLAKFGVNMIRFHGEIHSVTDDINQVNTREVDAIWKLVRVMRDEGIYVTISPFWPNFIDEIPASWGLGDYTDGPKPWALMYFEPRLKEAYKKWVEYLYTEPNPYTGIPLKDDPAVGLIQVQNEDGVFFWTIQSVEPSLQRLMEEQYHDWLVAKYGAINEAYRAWSGETMTEDNPAAGRMGIYIIWEATQERSGGKDRRLSDQIQFLAEVQRDFYQEIYDHYRAIGCQQLINATNWKTASPTRLFDAERWTNAACDVMAVNRYYSPQHVGENSGWRIDPGHHFVGASALKYPHKLPINIKQNSGHPFLVTESGWNLPNVHQAEGPFLIAAYQSLTGVDGYYWFSPSAVTYDTEPYFTFLNINGQHPMHRWTVSTPGQLGMFPANALMYRLGYIQQGETVVHEERPLQDIWDREIPVISEENSFDPNRDSYDNNGGGEQTEIAPVAYLAGPVKVTYGTETARATVSEDLDELLDFPNRTIHSTTGELIWDYEQGICLLDAPSAQGLCGFVEKDQPYNFNDVAIISGNDYVAVNVVAMDEKPLGESEKILIQVGTRYRPTNWRESSATFELGNEMVDGFRVDNTGRMPWKAANALVTVEVRNPFLKSAHKLTVAGYEEKEIYLGRNEESSTVSVQIPADAMYVVLDTRLPTTSVQTPERGAFQVYPNPSNGEVNIDITDGKYEFDRLEVVDTTGRMLQQWPGGKNHYSLTLPGGTYWVRLVRKDGLVQTEKLVVK